MFYRTIEKNIKLALSIPQFAEEMFALTDRNRQHLKAWLPWLDDIKVVEDTENFLRLQLKRFADGEALHLSIFYGTELAGVIAYNHIDNNNNFAKIGYWLGKEFTGKGIMLKAVRELISIGFENLSVNKVEIHCASQNIKSRGIPQKLGFTDEGTIRSTAVVNGEYQDHVVYGLLKEEYLKQMASVGETNANS